MRSRTLADEHEEAIQLAIEEYRRAAIEVWAFLAEGRRVPGVEVVSPSEVRRFFEAMPPEEWQALARRDPAAALNALRDFAEVSS